MLYRNKFNQKIYDLTHEPDEKGICDVIDIEDNERCRMVFSELEPAERQGATTEADEHRKNVERKLAELKKLNQEIKEIYGKGTEIL